MNNQLDATLKKMKALWVKHNSREPLVVARAVTGAEVPLVLIRYAAKNPADYYTQRQRFGQAQRAAGGERAALIAELPKTYRRLERSHNGILPELAYQPAN